MEIINPSVWTWVIAFVAVAAIVIGLQIKEGAPHE